MKIVSKPSFFSVVKVMLDYKNANFKAFLPERIKSPADLSSCGFSQAHINAQHSVKTERFFTFVR